jgi:antitoxin ParD1/3/4
MRQITPKSGKMTAAQTGAAMTLSLSPHVQEMIRKRLESGRYGSAEDVIVAGLEALDQEEELGDLAPGELDRLLEEAERSGGYVDGRQVFERLRRKHASGQQ